MPCPADCEALEVLRCQYFQLLDPAFLQWPRAYTLKDPDAQAWLFEHMFDRDAIQYCPPERYQVRVLKQLIARIEGAIEDPEEDEISDDLMSSLSLLLASRLPSEAESAQTKSYVTYNFGNERAVTLLETRNVIYSSGTTGLRTWEAALHLGAYLATSGSHWVRGKRILELGAGTGLLSILSTKHLQAAHATATDGDEGVVDAIKTNVFLNDLDAAANMEPVILRWGRPLSGTIYYDDSDRYDVVLGADVTYDKSAVPSLVSTLSELFSHQPALEVLIAATIRNEQTFEAFNVACRRHKLRFEDLAFTRNPDSSAAGPFDPTSTSIRILHITRPDEAAARDRFALL